MHDSALVGSRRPALWGPSGAGAGAGAGWLGWGDNRGRGGPGQWALGTLLAGPHPRSGWGAHWVVGQPEGGATGGSVYLHVTLLLYRIFNLNCASIKQREN